MGRRRPKKGAVAPARDGEAVRLAEPARPSLRAVGAVVALVLFAVLRSSWATRLDGFTIDEPWHVVAGLVQLRSGDATLNPEHPPLAKLAAAAALDARDFRLPPRRALADKPDERAYAEGAVFLENDPDVVQRGARRGMFVLNASLLVAFGLAALWTFGAAAALGATLFLALDPTVAAHLPVVMTDLPVTLLASLAALLAARALRRPSAGGALLAAAALGGALGAKHSGVLAAAGVAAGAVVALARASRAERGRVAAVLAAILVGAWLVLFGLYGFRKTAAGSGAGFNRPLAQKLADVRSPALRSTLRASAAVAPEAWVWGLADASRAALEGRDLPLVAFGRSRDRTPWWYFPLVGALKLPVGLLAAALAGLAFLPRAWRRLDPEARAGLGFLVAVALPFGAAVLVSEAGYAGIRHALPLFPALAVAAGLALSAALAAPRPRAAAVAIGLLAAVEALPATRPWEFFSVLAGGPAGGARLFNDEGVDLGQRTRELVGVLKRLAARNESAVVDYPVPPEILQRTGLGIRPLAARTDGPIVVSATRLAPAPWFDLEALRGRTPDERRGNLLVFRGAFAFPWVEARDALGRAVALLYGPKPDPAAAEGLLERAFALHPQAFVAALELGNVRLRRGALVEARAAYAAALAAAPRASRVRPSLERQVALLAPGSPAPPPLRNPWLE